MRYTPWENVPGLFQGVTVKDSSGRGVEFGSLRDGFPKLGFERGTRLKQVHGRRVLDLDRTADAACFAARGRPEADGVTGSAAGTLGIVSAADCVPAFLLDRGRRRWAAVHAGWRGVVAGVLGEAIRAMAGESPDRPGELELYLGPSICGACYEVGPDLAARLLSAGEGTGVEIRERRHYADLRAILKRQAVESGIRENAVAVSSYCTRCDNSMFCSFRAEGEDGLGLMWGIIGFRN